MKKQLPSLKEIHNFSGLQLVSVSDNQQPQETNADSELTQKLLSRLEKVLSHLDINHGPIEVVPDNHKVLH